MKYSLICSLLVLYIIIKMYNIERYNKKNHDVIGSSASSHQSIFTRPIIPNLIVPLRDHVHIRPVKVPLTPFTSPLLELPPLVGDKPNFLLWKPELLSPVRKQGECGSCWAFAACDMLSDRLTIRTGGVFRNNLSVQELLSCFDRDGCDGGSPEEACQWLEKTQKKLYVEDSFEYTSSKGGYVMEPCPVDLTGDGVRVIPNSTFSIVEFIEEEDYDENILKKNIENMKRALIETGPFFCAMSVYDDLFDFDGLSVYKKREGATLVGGHAIEIIGYCDKGIDKRMGFKEDGYWICRNSWGDDWPTRTKLKGYFMVKMGVNECGIESRCGFADSIPDGIFDPNQRMLTMNEMRYTDYNDYLR